MNWKGRKMFSSAVDMQSGGSVPYPSYQQGDLVMPAPLFEEGDQDINMALNTMASTTSPSVSDVKETVSIGPSMEDQMTMDQGPGLDSVKEKYQNIARQFAKNLSEQGGTMDLFMKQANKIEIAYSNEVEKMGEEVVVGDELLTPDFMQEIQMIFSDDIPQMQPGGVVPSSITKEQAQAQIDNLGYGNRFTAEQWMGLSEEDREKWTRLGPAINTQSGQKDTQMVMDRIDQILQARQKLAPQMAYAKPTKQGGILGFATQFNETKALEAAAKDKSYADALNAIRYGAGATAGAGGKIPAAVVEDLYGIDTMDKTWEEFMTIRSKGDDDFNMFDEIDNYLNLYGKLPKQIEKTIGADVMKNIKSGGTIRPTDFYTYYNLVKPGIIKEWNALPDGEEMGRFVKRQDNTPIPPELIFQTAVERWQALP